MRFFPVDNSCSRDLLQEKLLSHLARVPRSRVARVAKVIHSRDLDAWVKGLLRSQPTET